MKKIGLISITFAGRSGSILLSNILDGHSQIISLPPVYSFFEGPLEIIKLMQRIEFSSLKVFKRFKFYRLWWQKLLISFISETYKDLFSFDTVESKETGKFGLIETSVQTDQKSLNNSHKLELFKANISKLIFELKKVTSPKDLI